MLLAEELLLLALDPQEGTAVNGSREPLKATLCGALVAELATAGLVMEEGRRLVPSGAMPDDPLLAEVHARLGERAGRRAVDQLRKLDRALGGVWARLVDRLADEQVLGRRRDGFLIKVTHHPVLAPKVRDDVVERLRAAATGDGPMDARTATLLALAGPSRLLEVVAPERSGHRHAKKRIAEATDLTPVAPIVKKIIQEAQAAAATSAAVAGTVAATSGG